MKPAKNFLDFDSTVTLDPTWNKIVKDKIPLASFRDSVLVGCILTNDRLQRAAGTDDAACRLCLGPKESLHHLVHDCPKAVELIDSPKLDSDSLECFGPNFAMLGIVEFSNHLLEERLKISQVSELPLQIWNNHTPMEYIHIWTDGSCDFNKHYLHTLGAYSVIAEGGRVIAKGPVNHIALNPYACELWAVINAISRAMQPIIIHSDCLSIVNQFNSLLKLDHVPSSWSHWCWWNHLLFLLRLRRTYHLKPVILEWCPAHILEDLPCELISDSLAVEYGTNTRDIFHNRIADKIAKQALDLQKLEHHKLWIDRHAKILCHQKWLSLLHVYLSNLPQPCKQNHELTCEEPSLPAPHQLTISDELENFETILPLWVWRPSLANYTWTTSFVFAPLKSSASIHPKDWETAVSFFQSLKWHICDNMQTSFMELAYHCWKTGVRFENIDESPAKYATLLRKVISQANRSQPNHHIVPGTIHAVSKSNGKTHPSGLIQGGFPFLEADSLKALALPMLSGRKHPLKLWTSF